MKLIKKKNVSSSVPAAFKKVVTCEYKGRLGNNLFQIAVAVSYAKRISAVSVFSPWRYSKVFSNNLDFINGEKLKNYHMYEEKGFQYSPIEIPSSFDRIKLSGYFQSEKYFDETLVREVFTPRKDLIRYLREKYDLNNSVSVHVRRGDYLGLQDYHPVQNMDYYQEAFSYFQDSKFYVFSDDIDWCKNNFKGNFVFIDKQDDYLDMFLMSLCNHHIIANSSFSWWGAWLNKNKDKRVIMPKKWFGPSANHDINDLICHNWNPI